MESTSCAAVDGAPALALEPDATELWLRANLDQAVRPYQLWRENQRCVVIARRHALKMPERQGALLIEANEDARRMAALLLMAQLGAAVDRANLALDAHDIRTSQAALLRERIVKLETLAAEAALEAA
jgi:hypothetical protein